MDLTTLENVARLLELATEGMEADTQALIEAKIAEVSQRAETYCNRGFEKVERVSYHNGGGRFLFLKETPISEIDEILWADGWDWTGATEYGDTEYALIDACSGMVGYKFGYWPQGFKSIRVTFTGGYDAPLGEGEDEPVGYTPIPDDLEGAICQQVAYEYRRRLDPGLSSVSLPDGTINKMQVDEWLVSVKETLKRYRVRPG